MGDLPLDAVTVDHVQRYINQKAPSLAESTICKHLELMAQIFASALEDDLVRKNPFTSPRLRVIGKKSRVILAYTEEEFKVFEEKVLPFLTGGTLLYAAITLYTGMRQGEICALTWNDIDLVLGVIYVDEAIEWAAKNQGKSKDTKSPDGRRTMIILPRLRRILESASRDSVYVVHGPRSLGDEPASHEVMTRMRERINKVAAEHGVKLNFSNRRERHTIATFMNNAEVDGKTIAGQIGHTTVDFTRQRHMNPQMRQTQRGMNKLAEYISNL